METPEKSVRHADDKVQVPERETPTGLPLDGEPSSRDKVKSSVGRGKRVTPEASENATDVASSIMPADENARPPARTEAVRKRGRGNARPPESLTIRSYQVGFGDCFLLTFAYASSGDRHVLIDFGSTGLPKHSDRATHMHRVADDIVRRVGSEQLAVVATHRHRDHISGFATAADRKGTGDKIRACKPRVVVQPWTEDPDLPRNSKGPRGDTSGPRVRGFIAALNSMHTVAGAALAEAKRLEGRAPFGLVRQLAFLGQNNLENLSAVNNLMTMGVDQRYVHFGSESGLERFLPGVTTHVLGPPTLRQSDEISTQRQRDPDEFWHLQARAQTFALNASGSGTPESRDTDGMSSSEELFPDAARLASEPPPYARWFVPRIRALRAEQMLEIVRALDDVLNNTSVILLFEIAGRKFLFPGDAQLENWQYALSKPEVRDLLRDVDFYKVGHHGSLNATPKSLWNLFEKRSQADSAPDRLRTAVSTLSGRHGEEDRGTEVPRQKLVTALRDSSHFTTTQSIAATDLFREFTYELD